MAENQHQCIMQDRVRALENGQSETKVYVKQILDDLKEIKDDLKKQSKPDHSWQPIVVELIKLAGLCVTILGAIAGAAKILGK